MCVPHRFSFLSSMASIWRNTKQTKKEVTDKPGFFSMIKLMAMQPHACARRFCFFFPPRLFSAYKKYNANCFYSTFLFLFFKHKKDRMIISPLGFFHLFSYNAATALTVFFAHGDGQLRKLVSTLSVVTFSSATSGFTSRSSKLSNTRRLLLLLFPLAWPFTLL